MTRTYSFKLTHGPFGEETTSTIALEKDEDAMRMGKMLLDHAARAKNNPDGLSVVIGIEGGEEPQWLGAWHWDREARWLT